MKRILSAAAVVALLAGTGAGAAPGDAVRAYVNSHKNEMIQEYLKLAAIPDVHGDIPNLKKNADLLLDMMKKRGLDAEELQTADGVAEVFGQKIVPGAKHTILFYIHYDGQPVVPKRWAQPDPFTPVIRTDTIENGGKTVTDFTNVTWPDDWRIYARAVGDDRVPIEAILQALDALHSHPKDSVKIILDGEEEGGGTALAEVIKKYPDKLHSDLLVVLDSPEHASGKPTIFYATRGGAGLTVTVYTARQGMHSGNYGNWMPDANVRLAQLISSMVDPTGKVIIPGFYSDVLPLSPEAMAMINAVPDDPKKMQAAFGVGSVDGAASSLQEGLNIPSFSVHMMQGGEVGGVIPGSATAQIAMRLVMDNNPKVMVDRVVSHIKAQGYFVVDHDPDLATLASHPRVAKVITSARPEQGGGAWRTDPNSPMAVFVTDAMHSVWGDNLVRMRTAGGSMPAGGFVDNYHVPVVGIAIANYDDNQHTDNENLRLGNLYDGIVTLAAIMNH